MRVDRYDAVVDALLDAARARGLYVIARLQHLRERRLAVVDGGIERQRTTRLAGLGLHVFTADGSVGFASVDEIGPESARAAVAQAGALAEAARQHDAQRFTGWRALTNDGRRRIDPLADCPGLPAAIDPERAALDAQERIRDLELGADRTLRTTHHDVDEEWRIVRSDGTDVSYRAPRAQTRHLLSGRLDSVMARASAHVSGLSAAATLTDEALTRLTRRTRQAAADSRQSALAPPPTSGSYRIVLRHSLAKGLAHEAIGHLCEADVDGSVLMRQGRLRLGEPLARATVSVVDGPLPGEYVQQPVSANGLTREAVRLVDRGVLRAGLGDLFAAEAAGIPITGAGRAAGFRDRPTPRMTNIRIEVTDAASLDADPDSLTPDDVAAALRRAGLLDRDRTTIYLSGYRGGQAHPRRGDFVFAADASFLVSVDGIGAEPRGPASFSGLAERALASILAGIGPLCVDAIGTCRKDGSEVTSSGGSHALLVLDADPDLIVSAAT